MAKRTLVPDVQELTDVFRFVLVISERSELVSLFSLESRVSSFVVKCPP